MGLRSGHPRIAYAALIVLTVSLLGSIASAQQTPSAPSKFHFRQHPQMLAPHRPLVPLVPEAKRHPLPPAKAGSVIGGIWMTDANFKSKLHLRSIIANNAITVKPIIYLSNGTKVPLADVKLDPDGVAVIDLNGELAKQGISSFATLSGYIEVQYNWPWVPICATVRALDPIHSLVFYYNLQPSVHVSLPKFKPGQATVRPPAPTAAAHTVEGLWWKQEANVTGFVGLANTTAQPLTAAINVNDQQTNPIVQHTVTISPHGMKLVDLAELASTVSSSGGITITYTGLRDDLLVNGALQDASVGYSAMLPFTFVDTVVSDATQTSIAELGLMVGEADPMMSFPAGTTFTPYSVLRNISNASITANPTLWWMASGSPQYSDIPAITLAPHQSQALDMTSVLASAGLTNFSGSVNLVFDVQAKPGSLLLSAGSVDKTNNYVFAVDPRGFGESASKSLSYWSTGNGDDTMVTLWNPADEAQNLIFRLNYAGGHYLLPIQLGPKATRAFNVSDVIRAGTPDAEGNVIPPSAQEGSAVLMGSQAKIEHILVAVDAGTYNVTKATCYQPCWTCDGYSNPFIDLNPFGVPYAAQTQERFFAWWDDGNGEAILTSESDWWSENNSIMTVNNGSSRGMVTGQSVGTANIDAYDSIEPVYDPWFCGGDQNLPYGYCPDSGVGAPPTPGTTDDPTPVINSINPNNWSAGTTTYFTISGTGFGTNPSLSISGSGITGYGVSSAGDTQINAYVTIDPATTNETVTVTVTSNGYNGSGFQGNPGQSNSGSTNASVVALAAPAPAILFFGTQVAGTQNAVLGQQIQLTASVNTPDGLVVTSQSWSVPGTAIAAFTPGSTSSSEQVTQLLSFTSTSITFYWISTGGSAQAQYQVTYSYCLANNQCNSTSATFNVASPTNPNPNVTTTNVSVFNNSQLGDLLAYQAVNPSQPGIKFVAQSTLPSGNQGSYQWVQFIKSDKTQYINGTGKQSCSTFTGPAGTAELDTSYPYGNVTPSPVSTTTVPSDTATDSPNFPLPSVWGEVQRSFNATMYLRWIPNADSRCTSGNSCSIPVPLGNMTWSWEGDAIDTLQTQGNRTDWMLSCGVNLPANQVSFSLANVTAANNFGYLSWVNTVSSTCD